jgi:hypothetical protein
MAVKLSALGASRPSLRPRRFQVDFYLCSYPSLQFRDKWQEDTSILCIWLAVRSSVSTSHMLLLFTGFWTAPHCQAMWCPSVKRRNMRHVLIMLWIPLIPMSGDRQMDWQPERVMLLIHGLVGVSTAVHLFKVAIYDTFGKWMDQIASVREWWNWNWKRHSNPVFRWRNINIKFPCVYF